MLDWTSTAYVLWDDLSADALTPGQFTAIADWVRFGGQLIVNGADASDAIAKTPLADVLPLRPSGNIELDHDAGTELLRGWAVATDSSTEKQVALLRSQTGRIAVDGRAAEDAATLKDSGSLVLSRRVGSGRVVQSRFDLTSDWISTWKSYDSFVNAAVLRRPRRKFAESANASDEVYSLQRYPDHNSVRADPAMNTRFRILARDAILQTGKDSDISGRASQFDRLTKVDAVSGTSAWNDSSDAVRIAREILIEEAGIEIPDSSLIAKSLAYYLILLVPLNYLVFRIVGRLEFAWLAVPVIAIAGALWVARVARLDIGFARSQTEIGLLELHSGYSRGHLSRMVAIYNSLSDRYDVVFDTRDGAAMPLFADKDEIGQSGAVFKTSYAEGPILSGVAVVSGRTQHVHCEQMIDVGGALELSGQMLANRTDFDLFDACVIEKDQSSEVRVAVVGLIASAATQRLRFRDIAAVPIAEDLPMQSASLLRRLASSDAMPPGSSRLVGRIDGSLPGMTISPDSNQTAAQTVVIAHLNPAPLPDARVDVNLIGDLRRVNTLEPDANETAEEATDERDKDKT